MSIKCLFLSEKLLASVAHIRDSAWHFVCRGLLDYLFQEKNNMNPDEKHKQDQWKKTGNDPMKDQKRDQKGQQQQKPNDQPWKQGQPGEHGQQGQQGQKPQQPRPTHGQHQTEDEKDPNKRTA
jgi:hypothetical protein